MFAIAGLSFLVQCICSLHADFILEVTYIGDMIFLLYIVSLCTGVGETRVCRRGCGDGGPSFSHCRSATIAIERC